MKLPAKIKIFLWLLLWKRILTKDNLKKRGWLGDHSCMFCAGDESIDHLFFGCSLARFVWGVFQIAFDFVNIPTSLVDLTIAKILLAAIFWTLWKTRNRACFDHILPYDPVGVVFHICHWIDFWGDLQMERERRMLLQGARLLRRVAGEIFNRAKGWTTVGRRIEAGGTVDNPSLCWCLVSVIECVLLQEAWDVVLPVDFLWVLNLQCAVCVKMVPFFLSPFCCVLQQTWIFVDPIYGFINKAGGVPLWSKKKLRSTMTQERLNGLATISLENDVLEKINYEDIIEDFVSRNTRLMMLFTRSWG